MTTINRVHTLGIATGHQKLVEYFMEEHTINEWIEDTAYLCRIVRSAAQWHKMDVDVDAIYIDWVSAVPREAYKIKEEITRQKNAIPPTALFSCKKTCMLCEEMRINEEEEKQELMELKARMRERVVL